MSVVRAHIEMMNRLQAEEAMLNATQIGVGTGAMEKSDSKAAWSRWTRAASEPMQRDAVQRATPAALAAMGIAVVRPSKQVKVPNGS